MPDTRPVAKVMVSLPDDLLREIDSEATRRGTTRSGLLREVAEERFRDRSLRRARRMAAIDTEGQSASGQGGHVSELIKATRPSP